MNIFMASDHRSDHPVVQLAPYKFTNAEDREHSLTNELFEAPPWSVDDPARYVVHAQHVNDANPWKTLLKKRVDYDRSQCKAWKDDIDKIMLFAALFSAIVTAFTIESSKRLEVDYQETTAAILLVIHKQLDSLARQNVTTLPPLLSSNPTSSFQPHTSAVLVNALWYLSLLLSLSTVLIAILSLQWLREHLRDPDSGPENVFLIRALRMRSLTQWHMSTIVGTLPTLLLLASLLLFFAGLAILLWRLNGLVATAASTAIATIVSLLILTTVLPTFLARCAFKSPQAWAFYHIWDSLSVFSRPLRNLRTFSQKISGGFDSRQPITDWFSVDEETIKSEGNYGFHRLINMGPQDILMFVEGLEAKVSGGHLAFGEDTSLFTDMYYRAMGTQLTTTLADLDSNAIISQLSRNFLTDAALTLCLDYAGTAHPPLLPVLRKRRLELQLRILMYFSRALHEPSPQNELRVLRALMPALLRSTSGYRDSDTVEEEFSEDFRWQICKVNQLYLKEREGPDLRQQLVPILLPKPGENTCHASVLKLNQQFKQELAATESIIAVEAAANIAHYLQVWTYHMGRLWEGYDTKAWYGTCGSSFASLARDVQRKMAASATSYANATPQSSPLNTLPSRATYRPTSPKTKPAEYGYGIDWPKIESAIGISDKNSNVA